MVIRTTLKKNTDQKHLHHQTYTHCGYDAVQPLDGGILLHVKIQSRVILELRGDAKGEDTGWGGAVATPRKKPSYAQSA